MSERRFDIVFSGKLVADAEPQQVRQNVAALFKLDDDTLATLFSGERVTIKKGVDRATAVKYQQAMTKAGAVIQLVLHQSAEAQSSQAAQTQTAAPTAKPLEREPEATQDVATDSTADDTANGTLSVLPAGSDMLDQSERKQVTPVTVDTSHLQTEGSNSNPFLRDDTDISPAPQQPAEPQYPTPSIDAPTGSLELGELGAGSGQVQAHDERQDIDTSHLSAAQTGGELLTDKEREQLAYDTTIAKSVVELDLTLSEVGQDLLGDSEKTAPVINEVDTSQLSVEDIPQ